MLQTQPLFNFLPPVDQFRFLQLDGLCVGIDDDAGVGIESLETGEALAHGNVLHLHREMQGALGWRQFFNLEPFVELHEPRGKFEQFFFVPDGGARNDKIEEIVGGGIGGMDNRQRGKIGVNPRDLRKPGDPERRDLFRWHADKRMKKQTSTVKIGVHRFAFEMPVDCRELDLLGSHRR